MSKFKKAVKEQSKLRATIYGPSGSGKTFTALRIGTGMIQVLSEQLVSARMAVICSERGRAAKYGDRFDFDVLELESKTIEAYSAAIAEARKEGYPVIVIDSLTHAWYELLDEVDKLAKQKFNGNTWAAWSVATPKQKNFIDLLLTYPGHVITTMRSKSEWVTEDKGGKKTPKNIGTSPEQRGGIEYEFDMVMCMSTEHHASVTKDITNLFQDQVIEKPGEDIGKAWIEWLNAGPAPVAKEQPPEQPAKKSALHTLEERASRCASKEEFTKLTSEWNAAFDGLDPEKKEQQKGNIDKGLKIIDKALKVFEGNAKHYERIETLKSAVHECGGDPGKLAVVGEEWLAQKGKMPPAFHEIGMTIISHASGVNHDTGELLFPQKAVA